LSEALRVEAVRSFFEGREPVFQGTQLSFALKGEVSFAER
jgi:hypothetical protein